MKEQAYIRNGAVVTVVTRSRIVAGYGIGVAGDMTKDVGGTILARPGSTLEVKAGGVITTASVGGIGLPDRVRHHDRGQLRRHGEHQGWGLHRL